MFTQKEQALAADGLELTIHALASFEAELGTAPVSEQNINVEAFELSDDDIDGALGALF